MPYTVNRISQPDKFGPSSSGPAKSQNPNRTNLHLPNLKPQWPTDPEACHLFLPYVGLPMPAEAALAEQQQGQGRSLARPPLQKI